jgi:hypothetical protein
MSINLYIPKDKFIEIMNSKLVDEIILKQELINRDFIQYQYHEQQKQIDSFRKIFGIVYLKNHQNNQLLIDKIKSIGNLIFIFNKFVDQLIEYRNLIEKDTILDPMPIPYPSKFIKLLFEEKIKFYPTFIDILYYVENGGSQSVCSKFLEKDDSNENN